MKVRKRHPNLKHSKRKENRILQKIQLFMFQKKNKSLNTLPQLPHIQIPNHEQKLNRLDLLLK